MLPLTLGVVCVFSARDGIYIYIAWLSEVNVLLRKTQGHQGLPLLTFEEVKCRFTYNYMYTLCLM